LCVWSSMLGKERHLLMADFSAQTIRLIHCSDPRTIVEPIIDLTDDLSSMKPVLFREDRAKSFPAWSAVMAYAGLRQWCKPSVPQRGSEGYRIDCALVDGEQGTWTNFCWYREGVRFVEIPRTLVPASLLDNAFLDRLSKLAPPHAAIVVAGQEDGKLALL